MRTRGGEGETSRDGITRGGRRRPKTTHGLRDRVRVRVTIYNLRDEGEKEKIIETRGCRAAQR